MHETLVNWVIVEKNLLDTLAFILITPELIGEKKLGELPGKWAVAKLAIFNPTRAFGGATPGFKSARARAPLPSGGLGDKCCSAAKGAGVGGLGAPAGSRDRARAGHHTDNRDEAHLEALTG